MPPWNSHGSLASPYYLNTQFGQLLRVKLSTLFYMVKSELPFWNRRAQLAANKLTLAKDF